MGETDYLRFMRFTANAYDMTWQSVQVAGALLDSHLCSPNCLHLQPGVT